ncbi:response regulator transcription factor [Sulfurimonas sp.]|jgi:DNA-binding response OmpR family regulator|uniref:response regulator transcription factor n=1 Tax=Sulfurimonas sp. TaxID=2022749 RepID=UPI0025F79D24|nr:response regulator transcription factor [Sulfurimonas sp.]MCK9473251.1 response regulator transcription factor [Sulfurimonas sp.]MDD3505426.1 response regulator transcription factor [Sulfurimonas sp.]
MRILLLEDEFSLRISIKEFLEDINYEVDDYADGLDAYDAIYSKSYDLLLLDVNVPSMNGFELLQSVRKDNNKTPAIFLTSMTDIENFNEGYKKGCCDYIRKPFELLELELRVKQAILRFYLDDSEQIMISETIFYDMLKGKLMLSGKEIVLRKIEKDILELLLKNKNSVVSMQMFQEHIWGDYVEPATIRVQVNNLKQKLPDDIIQNRRGMGYIIER